MNLEKEMKKLSKVGYKNSEKDMEKISDVMRRYAGKHDLTENRARQQYEWMFDFSCRQAEELNMELWVHLSTEFMIPGEGPLIKPPNTLKNKKKEQDWIKGRFWPFYYECMLNCVHFPIMDEFSTDLLSLREGGEDRGEQKVQERIEREEIIIQKAKWFNVKELLAFPPTDRDGNRLWKKDINKLVADSIPGEKVKYVRELLESVKYNP